MRTSRRTMRTILQTAQPIALIADHPVMHGLPRHPIPGRDLRLRRTGLNLHHRMETLLHNAQLPKSHPNPFRLIYRRNEPRRDPRQASTETATSTINRRQTPIARRCRVSGRP